MQFYLLNLIIKRRFLLRKCTRFSDKIYLQIEANKKEKTSTKWCDDSKLGGKNENNPFNQNQFAWFVNNN